MSGWICSYRSIWDHPFFKGNGMRVAIWHWLLHHAAWKETTHKVDKSILRIKRGEVCFSLQQIQDETGATRKQVRAVLEWLIRHEKAAKIGANERANKGANVRANARTVLRIEKYDEYQSGDDRGANERANKGADDGPIKEQGITNNNTSPNGEDAGASNSQIEISVLSKVLWEAGKLYLGRHDVKNPGGMIGRWLKASKPVEILSAIEAAQKSGTQDPVSYITKILNQAPPQQSGIALSEIEEMFRNA